MLDVAPEASDDPVPRDDTAPEADSLPPALDDSPLGPVPVPERKPPLDALVDSIASIDLEGALVSGEAALAAASYFLLERSVVRPVER
mgnify:CR=1 FL=1